VANYTLHRRPPAWGVGASKRG